MYNCTHNLTVLYYNEDISFLIHYVLSSFKAGFSSSYIALQHYAVPQSETGSIILRCIFVEIAFWNTKHPQFNLQ